MPFSRLGLSLLLFAGCAVPALASVSIYMGPEQLARRAPIVVEGTVTRTASGFDPERASLATYTTLAVERVHRGPSGLGPLVIREPGGRYGDLVHQVDAAPVYTVGERVIAFLENAPDGALRTSGMFFGKFVVAAGPDTGSLARRDLEGRGRIFGMGADPREVFFRDDLVELVAGGHVTADRRAIVVSPTPPELGRLRWDDVVELPAPGGPGPEASFVPLGSPTRWMQPEADLPVVVNVQPGGNPLGDAAAAVGEIGRALDSWTQIPEARIALTLGDTELDYIGSHPVSPVSAVGDANIVLFDDPYDDIPNGEACSGVLAIGGFWRSGTIGATVNGVGFHAAIQLYAVFNDGMECFLSDPVNLAEIAAHEIGHGLGFGHSPADDAIMRATAYGNRGARLGDDDRDAAHCFYPHAISLSTPSGGELWQAGSTQAVEWTSSLETGADPGQVDLELSTDGGTTWTVLSAGEPNDGHYAWSVPEAGAEQAWLRIVRRIRGPWQGVGPAPTCSASAPAGPVVLTSPQPVAARRVEQRRRGVRLLPNPRPSAGPTAPDTAPAAAPARSWNP